MSFIKNKDELTEIAKEKIVSIISIYVELKPSGANHIGLCPFHDEKTPSFIVSQKKGIFKCFGCGLSGDAINFLIEKENFTFLEAIEQIGKITGTNIEISENFNKRDVLLQAKQEQEKKQSQLALIKDIYNVYYYNRLPFSAIDWFKPVEDEKSYYKINIDGRYFKYATLKAFKISFAPLGNFLTSVIKSEGWDSVLLHEIGLVKTKNGNTYDFFRERLLFPITNHFDKIVGFAGRKLNKDSNPKNPKYINSPESLAYKKDKLLYGLSVNKVGIKETQKALLVEGYTDVLSLFDYGINYSVATCGTAFSKEQAQLLKRFTDVVIIMRDGDEAGYNAAKRDVETAIQVGLQTKICLLPEGEDPDSFIRKEKKEGFEKHLANNVEDAILWRVMLEWDEEDSFKRNEAYEKAAELLSHLESDLLREEYIRKLTKKGKMGSVTRILKEAIAKKAEDNLKKGKGKLSKQQQYDALHFGIYEANSKYFICNDLKSGTGTAISNFIIRPVMLIVARNESRRLVEIINEHKHSFLADIDSKVFSEFYKFSQFIEGMGNYMYNEFAKQAHHLKIKRKIYGEMPTCFPIYTMGWHREGFYTWGNGIITLQGKFQPVNEYGLVEHAGTKYFLKAFSIVNLNIKSDDDENTFEDQINFAFEEKITCISFNQWSKLMLEVHGDNAMIAIAWYLAALFRDILYPKFNFFPHLNHFGPPSSGKSFLAWSLQYLFGSKPKSPFHLVNGTDAAFSRTLSWVRNAIAWFDEYSNDVSFERVEHLKSAYDGAGREKGKGAYGHNVTRTPVNSACLITGQQQPTKDIALMERCITLNFKGKERTKEQINKSEKLREIEKTGQLTQLTSQLQKFRPIIEERFFEKYDNLRSIYRSRLQQDGIIVKDRILANHLIPLTVAGLIMTTENFAFPYDSLIEVMYQQIIKHSETLDNQNEESIFWQIADFMLAKKIISHGEDIIVETKRREKVKDEKQRRQKRDTVQLEFENEIPVLYIQFTKLIPEYHERHQRSRGKNGLDTEALKYYLRNSEAYIGQKHGKKFNGYSKSCYVFELNKLPLEWKLTVEELNNQSHGDDFDDDFA